VRRLRELSAESGHDRGYIPQFPSPSEMDALGKLIESENEAMRMTPERMKLVQIEGGRALLARRTWDQFSPQKDTLLGYDVLVHAVDWATRTVKVSPTSDIRAQFLVSVNALAPTVEMRLREQPELYMPPVAKFAKGEQVRVSMSGGSGRCHTGKVVGYLTRNRDLSGATWENPGYAVQYDNSRTIDNFEAEFLEAILPSAEVESAALPSAFVAPKSQKT